jgi:hypothetical protein
VGGTVPPVPHTHSWRAAKLGERQLLSTAASYTYTAMTGAVNDVQRKPWKVAVTNMQTSRLSYHKDLRGKPSNLAGNIVLTWNKRTTFMYTMITLLANHVMIQQKSSGMLILNHTCFFTLWLFVRENI